MRRFSIALLALLALLCSATAWGADWPQFRGDNSNGVSPTKAPVEFSPGRNELWSAKLESGHSSPCIVGDVILLTTFDAQRKELAVVCLDRRTGQTRWRREVPADEIERGHPSFNPASSTPASDGERVVAYFGSCGLFCYDLSGNVQWERRLPLTKSYAGNATSPIITGDRVILYRGNYVDHFAWALDKRTGEELWKVQQSEKFSTDVACTATPIVANGAVILHSARAVQALDLASGERVWRLRCATTATSTPILAGDEVIVATWNQTGEASLTPTLPSFEKLLADRDRDGDKMIGGKEFPRLMIFHRSEGVEAPQNGAPLRFAYVDADKNGKINSAEWERWLQKDAQRRTRYTEHGLLAIPLKSAGEVSDDRIRRLAKEGIPEVPSPLHYRGRAYFVKNGGILTCIDLKTGNRDYRLRTRGRGTHYASPVIAGEHLYTASGDGKISVIHLGDKGKIVAVNDMGDPVYATPAVVDGVIYVRTHHTLYAFGVKR